MKAVEAAFNQEKALVGAFSVIANLRMELFEALVFKHTHLVVKLWIYGGHGPKLSTPQIYKHFVKVHFGFGVLFLAADCRWM